MSDAKPGKSEPKVARWATGTSDTSLERSLHDQVILEHGRLNQADDENRTTPSGLSRLHYDALRLDRDDLDYREWNESTGFSGVGRWPTGPGLEAKNARTMTEAERRRARRRKILDEGF